MSAASASRSATTPAGPIRSNIGSESAAPSWITVMDASASPMPAPRPANGGDEAVSAAVVTALA